MTSEEREEALRKQMGLTHYRDYMILKDHLTYDPMPAYGDLLRIAETSNAVGWAVAVLHTLLRERELLMQRWPERPSYVKHTFPEGANDGS